MGWHTLANEPEIGRKIIALYSDGSGATLLFRYDGGYLDEEGDEAALHDEHYSHWAYLPDGFRLWAEDRAEDPITLPASLPLPTPAQEDRT